MDQPLSSASRSTVTRRQLISWFLIIPFVLVASFIPTTIIDYIRLLLMFPFQSEPATADWTDGVRMVLSAVTFGITSAVLIGYSWRRLVQSRNVRWTIANGLVMCIGLLLTGWALGNIDLRVPEGGFRLWRVLPIASIGAGIGAIQWRYLRRWVLSAEWWILVMSISWLLVWLVFVALIYLIGD